MDGVLVKKIHSAWKAKPLSGRRTLINAGASLAKHARRIFSNLLDVARMRV